MPRAPMMHVDINGNAVRCRAKVKECPRGKANHIRTSDPKEAAAFAEKRVAEMAKRSNIPTFAKSVRTKSPEDSHVISPDEMESIFDFEITYKGRKSENFEYESLNDQYLQFFVKKCEENGVTPDADFIKKEDRGISSANGNHLETAFSNLVKTIGSQNLKGNYVGKEIEREIALSRKRIEAHEISKDECANLLAEKYSMNRDVLAEVLTNDSSISIPDVVSVFKLKSGISLVRIGEAKAGGQLDVKNLPKNLEALVGNSLFERENQVTERAVLLTATSDRGDGSRAARFPHKGSWVNQIQKTGYGDKVDVLCNEEAAQWASGRKISSAEYGSFVTRFAEESGNAMYEMYKRNVLSLR